MSEEAKKIEPITQPEKKPIKYTYPDGDLESSGKVETFEDKDFLDLEDWNPESPKSE